MDFKERNISLGHKLTKETLSIDLNEDWDPEILFWDPLPEISGSLLGNFLILAAVFGFVTSNNFRLLQNAIIIDLSKPMGHKFVSSCLFPKVL